jgi:hypothetical protein
MQKNSVRPIVLWSVAILCGLSAGIVINRRMNESEQPPQNVALELGFESPQDMKAITDILDRAPISDLSGKEIALMDKYARKKGAAVSFVVSILHKLGNDSVAIMSVPIYDRLIEHQVNDQTLEELPSTWKSNGFSGAVDKIIKK